MDKNTNDSDNNNRSDGAKTDGEANRADGTPSSAEPTEIMDAVFSHLLVETAKLLGSTIDERVNHIQSDRFILHADAKIALSEMKKVFKSPHAAVRPECLAVIGNSNEGKSALVTRFYQDCVNNPQELFLNDDEKPVLLVRLPPRATQPAIALALARELGLASYNGVKSRHLTDNIFRVLKNKKVKLVLFDEFHHVSPLPKHERQVVYDFVKSITTEHIHVLAIGTEDAREKLAEDEQLSNRFRVVRLRSFANNNKLKDFLCLLETYYPLPKASHLYTHSELIYKMTNGITGEVVALCNAAAVQAVRKKWDCIDAKGIKAACLLPTSRAA